MGDPQPEILYHNGCIVDSVVLSPDELHRQGKLARTKILDDLTKDCTSIGRKFRMVKTKSISILYTLNLIDKNPNQVKQNPRDLANNDAKAMQDSFIKIDDSFHDTEQNPQVKRKIAESQPTLEKMIEKVNLGLDEIYEVEMKWQRHKSDIAGAMVATREAIKRTTTNIKDLRVEWYNCIAIMD